MAEVRVRGTQGSGMLAALAATASHPEWWAMALATFLVRGGIVIIALPIIPTPTSASLTNRLSPTIEDLYLAGPTLPGVILGTIVIAAVLGLLYAAALAGSWLDLAQVREATTDPELELSWRLRRPSASAALGIRLLAHVPTLAAVGFATIRLYEVTYAELLSPGGTAPIALRVLARAPDAVGLVVATWLVGETVGGLVARHYAAGEALGSAIRRTLSQLVSVRGAATFLVTNLALAVIAVPFLAATGTAWEHLRVYLLDGVTPGYQAAALALMVATWLLGLAVLGVALAWRATAWTLLVAPERVSLPERSPTPTHEVATG